MISIVSLIMRTLFNQVFRLSLRLGVAVDSVPSAASDKIYKLRFRLNESESLVIRHLFMAPNLDGIA